MTPGQCRAARSWLAWTVTDTARAAGVARGTLIKFEKGGNINYNSLDKIRRAYEREGIEFRGRIYVIHHGDNGLEDD